MTKEKLIKAIAATIVATACNETLSGSWCFYFEEIEEMFDLEKGVAKTLIKDINNEVMHYNAIAETEIVEDINDYSESYLDLSIYGNYCDLDFKENA